MPQRVKCPTGHMLVVPDSRAGKVVVCPRCNQSVSVPQVKRSGVTPTAETESPAVPKTAQEIAASIAAALDATRQLQAPVAPPVPAKTPETEPALKPRPKKPRRPVVTDPQIVLEALTGKRTPPVEAERAAESERTPVLESPPPSIVPAAPALDVDLPEPKPFELKLFEPPLPEPPTPESLHEPEPVAEPAPLLETTAPAPPDPPVPTTPVPPPEPVSPAVLETVVAKVIPELDPPPVAPPPPPAPAEEPPTYEAAPPPWPGSREGIIHEPARLLTAWQVAAAVALAAIFSMCPALIDIVDHFRSEESPSIGRWAWAVLLVGAVQLAYALYISQLPDWSTLWVASLQSLAAAAAYAAVLGFVITSKGDHWLIAWLQLTDQIVGGRAALWCIAMIAAMSLLAYFAGFVSVRWHKAEAMMRALALRHY